MQIPVSYTHLDVYKRQVVDVAFENGELPAIKDALEVQNGDKKCVMEVAQHIGNDVVRCVMLASSEGLSRDMEVVATGSGIKTPVGKETLGRLFNVLGEAIDGGKALDDADKWEIHREAPSFDQQNPAQEILETGIKAVSYTHLLNHFHFVCDYLVMY